MFDFHNKKANNKHERIELSLQRVVSTHKYFCVRGSMGNFKVILFEARKQAYVKRKIFISEGNRCCYSHLIKQKFYEEDLNYLKVFSNNSVGKI